MTLRHSQQGIQLKGLNFLIRAYGIFENSLYLKRSPEIFKVPPEFIERLPTNFWEI